MQCSVLMIAYVSGCKLTTVGPGLTVLGSEWSEVAPHVDGVVRR